MSVLEELRHLAAVDLFSTAGEAAQFVGRPFYFDYSKMHVLVNDAWKQRVGGIPAGAFLVAVYDNEPDLPEVVLVRVLGPTPLPTDSDVIASMVDYYKENVPTGGAAGCLDNYTRYEFQFSGLACRVLGSFFRTPDGQTAFGADVDNFYSANNYSVYKPVGKVLE
ncbi:MAG: ATPase, partial [Chloroflexota bacterium]|nr:ATPase [Chloroflexota bacterium]